MENLGSNLLLVLYIVLELVVWCSASTILPAPQMEVNALYDLYEATGGPNWKWKSVEGYGAIWNFTGNPTPCNSHWQGIECIDLPDGANSVFHVAQISLSEYRLRGTLPASLQNLTDLKSLALASNALHGPIPSFLGNMVGLVALDLTENLLTGKIPESFGNLTMLSEWAMCTNFLSGTIPSFIAEMTALRALGLCDAGLTGTIPPFLGELTLLEVLGLQANDLHGIIPESLSNLPSLEWLYLYNNHLTGTISDSLCDLSSMQRFLMYGNALTGTIPDCIGEMGLMSYFDVSSNDLHGSLPASLSDLDELLFLWAHDNQLTGPIPEDIGNCGALTEIYLSGNYLSQSLPASISSLTALTSIYLEDNQFNGALTTIFDEATSLEQVYLDNNMFSGPLPKPFPGLSNLTQLFLQSNKFSGQLTGLFDSNVHHSLEMLQLSDNQFTGPLPAEIFLLPRLQTCAASFNCLTGTIPASICLNRALTTLILDGLKSAPICQSRLVPGLSTYYVPQNHHGSIPACLLLMRNLTTLHLAGNALTGPLPPAVSNQSILVDLSISHNALTGTISAALQTRPWTTLDLSFNRLTGGVDRKFGSGYAANDSSSLSLQNNRLSGKLPGALDHLRNISVLGSNMFSCKVDKSDLPQYDGEVDTYSCGSDSFNYSYITLIGALFLCAALVLGSLYYSAVASRAPLVEKALNSVAKWAVDANPDLQFYRRVCALGDLLCEIGIYTTVLILLVLMPWYISASYYYGTYTHTYAWVVSAAFLTGSAPAYVEMGFFMALMLFVASSSVYLVGRLDKASASQRPSSLRRNLTHQSVQTAAVRVSLPVRIAIYAAFLAINLTVVVGMNVAFVVMVLTQGNFVQFLAQVLVGAFKLVWNTVCTPYLINICAIYISGTTYNDEAFATLQVLIALLNNIAIPCLVVAFISPSCFYSVFDPPPPVVSSFTYKTTARPGLGLTGATVFTYYATEEVSYAPPFAYDYQCSSSLITYYAPAFVYLAIGAALVSPAVWTALVQWHRRATAGTLWYRAVDALLYDIWKPVNAEKSPPPYLFEVNLHFVTLITYLGILLTFGVVFPPVAVAMCATMISVNWQVKLSVGRFLYKAKKARALHLVQLVEQECKGAVSLVKLRRSLFLAIIFACFFLGLFLFDTLGDAKELAAAIPILVVMALFPIVIYLLAYLRPHLPGWMGAEVVGNEPPSEPEVSAIELSMVYPSALSPGDERAVQNVSAMEEQPQSEEVINILVIR